MLTRSVRPIPSQTRVDIVYFTAGSGHCSAAHGLRAALQRIRPEWRIRAVDLVDVVAGYRVFQLTTRAGVAYFNWMLRRERVVDLRGLVRFSFFLHDLLTPRGLGKIARFWRDCRPDAVVSMTPMNNEALSRSARLLNPRAIYVTVPVDFEELMPRYWFTPSLEHHYLTATDRLYNQARRAGIPESMIHRLSGMIVDPAFYQAAPADVSAELNCLGLDPDVPTALVSFGGQGSVLVREAAHHLARSGLRINLILLCGRNQSIFRELDQWRSRIRKIVREYSPEPPSYYYHLSSLVIGKPGSMTITEALVAGATPVLVASRGMAPVQRANAAWVRATQVGVVVDDIETLGAAVRGVLREVDRYRGRAADYVSHGVFEAAEIVASLIARH